MKCVHLTPPDSFDPTEHVVACFIQCKYEILLLKRKNNKPFGGMWGLPAGKISHQENYHEAIKREVFEETGLELCKPQYINKFYAQHPNVDFEYHLFHAYLHNKEEVILSANEHTKHEWVSAWHTDYMDLIPGLDESIEYFFKDNYHLRYWEEQDFRDLRQASSFEELAEIGLRILRRMPQPIVQVCGPISSGGTLNTTQNIRRFQFAVSHIERQRINVFRQMPFEEKIRELVDARTDRKGYCYKTLKLFYKPLFDSGLINRFYFIPNYIGSLGTEWEMNYAIKNKHIIIDFIPEEVMSYKR